MRQKTGKRSLTLQTLESLEPKSNRCQRAGSQKKDHSHLRILERLRNCDCSENGYRWSLSTWRAVGRGQAQGMDAKTRRSHISGDLPPSYTAKQWSHMAENASIQNCMEFLLRTNHCSGTCGYGREQNTKTSAISQLLCWREAAGINK